MVTANIVIFFATVIDIVNEPCILEDLINTPVDIWNTSSTPVRRVLYSTRIFTVLVNLLDYISCIQTSMEYFQNTDKGPTYDKVSFLFRERQTL